MYELGIAAKYLIPRRRQLSVSIISMVSILVIAVVVWLIVVFFSVTNGLMNSWVDKLIALTAPVRVTPTPHYYQSHYYLIDSISGASDYSLKTIGEKWESNISDPYDANYDTETPLSWPAPERRENGDLIDPVQSAFAAIHNVVGVSGITATDYETTMANLRLRILRQKANPYSISADQRQSTLSQVSYLGSMDPNNQKLLQAIAPPSMQDLTNLLSLLAVKADDSLEEVPGPIQYERKSTVRQRLSHFFKNINIEQLKTPEGGWRISKELLPQQAVWDVTVIKRHNIVDRMVIAQQKNSTSLLSIPFGEGYKFEPAKLTIFNGNYALTATTGSKEEISKAHLKDMPPIFLEQGSIIHAKLNDSSISNANDASSLIFFVKFRLQDNVVEGPTQFGTLQISKATINTLFSEKPELKPFWTYSVNSNKEPAQLILPTIEGMGDGILLPKSFKTAGTLLGDTGYLSYYAPTASSIQEQRIPVFVSGFYDPGIIPIGGKYILAPKEITTLIRSFYNHEEVPLSNGINVRLDQPSDADNVKEQLQKAFAVAGITPYWKIETYRDFEFTKDIIQQLESEKRLYTLLATLIIIVACSNIISMLIILVNDKKLEIGILRSMGATSLSIAAIFGTCGLVMGAVGSLLGILAALITVRNIQPLVDFIGRMQGYEMFNPLFYGDSLPSEVSYEALTFVIGATTFISLLAGIIPAVKASLLKPSAILKAE
ncbi:MAG: FtsX-like permease family protein [Parachlamydiaceae bacterium]|nr:FtsX-like permease family protein [Parachlamydiaceae bacterium]